jgi:hypothetical protein
MIISDLATALFSNLPSASLLGWRAYPSAMLFTDPACPNILVEGAGVCAFHLFKDRVISSRVRPQIRIDFSLEDLPDLISTLAFGIPSFLARNSMRALFAFPSTGGEVSFTLKRSPSLPIIWFLEDLGRTLTLIRLCELTRVGFRFTWFVLPEAHLDPLK